MDALTNLLRGSLGFAFYLLVPAAGLGFFAGATPVWINSSTWAFTFSTPASASTTGAVSEGAAARLASSSTVTLLTGANVSATRHAKIRREKLSITAWG